MSRPRRTALAVTTSVASLVAAGFVASGASAASWGPAASGVAADAAQEAASPRIIGGGRVPITAAPWQVRVTTTDGFLCGGSVIDARRILTAAHCTFSQSSAPLAAGSFTVESGVSGPTALAGDARQVRAVSAVRRHPYYSHPGPSGSIPAFADDAAVLTLSAPLDLSGPATRAVPLSGASPVEGTPASVTGYGVQDEDSGARDGFLHGVATEVVDPSSVGATNAVSVQATSAAGSSCFGDSGGPLTAAGTQIGLVSVGVRCGAGTADVYTNVGAPEIRRFIDGDDAPPRAPRGGRDPSLRSTSSVLRPGDVVRCGAGAWDGGPSYRYRFRDGLAGTVLTETDSDAYRLRVSDVGRRLSCQASATNAGGTGRSLPTEPASATRSALRPSLKVSASTSRPRRGGRASYRVRLRSRTAAVSRNVKLCARLSSRYRVTSRSSGGKVSKGQLCWTVQTVRGRGTASRGFRVRFDRDGSRSRLRTRATARSTGVTTASASRTVRVR